jgi:hypothetical protein
MCTGLEPALITAAIGAGTTAYGQHQAAKQQDSILADNVRRNMEANAKGGARIAREVQNVKKSSVEPERAAAQNEFLGALRKAKLSTQGGLSDPEFGGSQRFAEDVGAARTASDLEGATSAGQLARIDAPVRQRMREGTGFNRAASDLMLIGDKAGGDDFLSRLRLAMTRPNQGTQIAGDLLSGLGSGLANRAKPVPVNVPTRPIPGLRAPGNPLGE